MDGMIHSLHVSLSQPHTAALCFPCVLLSTNHRKNHERLSNVKHGQGKGQNTQLLLGVTEHDAVLFTAKMNSAKETKKRNIWKMNFPQLEKKSQLQIM